MCFIIISFKKKYSIPNRINRWDNWGPYACLDSKMSQIHLGHIFDVI